MRAEILLLLCHLARRQYGTVRVTADRECAAVALCSEPCTYALNTGLEVGNGRHTRGDVHAYDVIFQMLKSYDTDNPLLVER